MTNTPSLDPVLSVLLELRERVDDPNSWCAGYGDIRNRVMCVGRHLANIVADGYWSKLMSANHPATKLLADAVCHYAGIKRGFNTDTAIIGGWNDDYATHADVLAVTELAITLRIEELDGEGLPAFLLEQAG